MAYPPQLKADAVAYALRHPGKTSAAVGDRFQVPERTVRKWVKAANDRRSEEDGGGEGKGKAGKGKEGGKRSSGGRESRVGGSIVKRGGRRLRVRAPAVSIAVADREEAVSIVRRTRSIAKRYLDNFEERLDAWEEEMERIEELDDPAAKLEAIRLNKIPRVDREETQALLNLQKVAAEVLDTHPGLLELDQGSGPKTGDTEERRARVRAALGIGEPSD